MNLWITSELNTWIPPVNFANAPRISLFSSLIDTNFNLATKYKATRKKPLEIYVQSVTSDVENFFIVWIANQNLIYEVLKSWGLFATNSHKYSQKLRLRLQFTSYYKDTVPNTP